MACKTKCCQCLQNRWLLLFVGALHTVLTSGVILGVAGLQHSLMLEGVMSEACEQGAPQPCDQQLSFLNLMFVLAGCALNFSNIIFGTILDRFGPKVCGIMASSLFFIGTIFMEIGALAKHWHPYLEYAYIVGFTLFGLAGPGVMLPTYHISNLFKYSSFIIALDTALFDASTAVFLVVQLLHQYLHIKLYIIFAVYAGLVLLILVSGAILWPNYTFEKTKQESKQLIDEPEPTPAPADKKEEEEMEMEPRTIIEENFEKVKLTITTPLDVAARMDAMADDTDDLRTVDLETEMTSRDIEMDYKEELATMRKEEVKEVEQPQPVEVAKKPASKSLKDLSFLRQLFSVVFMYTILFGAIHILRLNFVVATVDSQLKSQYGEDSSWPYTLKLIFEFMLPCGFFGIPVIGFLLGKSLYFSVLFVNIFTLLYGIAFMIPVHAVSIIGFAIYSTCRQFVFSTIFTSIAETFGYRHFGKLLGINNVAVALFSLIQYPLVEVVHRFLNGSFLWVNVGLLSSSALPLLVGLLFYKQLHANLRDEHNNVVMMH